MSKKLLGFDKLKKKIIKECSIFQMKFRPNTGTRQIICIQYFPNTELIYHFCFEKKVTK